MNMDALLRDKKVLYVMVFFALFTILGYLFTKDFNAIIFFLLVGSLTTYFSKNMIVVLFVALLSTNLLVAMHQTPQFIREGMGKKDKEDKEEFKERVALIKKKKKKPSTEEEEEETEVVEVKNSSAGLDKVFAGKQKSSDVTLDVDIDNAKTLEQAYDNIDNILGKGGVKNMSDDTTKLIEKQKVLMNNIKQMKPMVSSAKAMLQDIREMGIDVDGIIKQVSPQMMNTFASKTE
jgi:archaellum component FlaG (FlaF/FlaG flagellin family)